MIDTEHFFTKIFLTLFNNFNFQPIVKLINMYWVFKFQAILWTGGAKIGVQKVDIKIDFKEELLQNTYF